MKIFAKLLTGFVLVALLCAVVGGVGWFGINTTAKSLMEVSEVRVPAVAALGSVMEMMNAIKSAERTMIVAAISKKDRMHEIENLKKRWSDFDAGLSQYVDLPKSAEETALVTKFNEAIGKWKIEHQKLVELVATVELDDVEHVDTILVERQLDHVKWVATLDKDIAARSHFEKQIDPALCEFGKWLGGFTSEDAKFNAILATFNEPHKKLHGLGETINGLMAQGDYEGARALFNREVAPTLVGIESIFKEARDNVAMDMAALKQATKIAFGSEREAFSATVKVAEELVALNAKISTEVSQDAKSSAASSKLVAMVITLLAALIAVVLGISLSRSIVGPLKQVVDNLGELEKGHLGGRLHLRRSDEIGEMAETMDRFSDSLEHEVVDNLKKLADGDLTFKVEARDGQDVLRGSLQQIARDLRTMIADIQTAGEQINSGSQQIADSSQSLSQGATESAASIEEITSSMTEMGSQTRLNAENATQASRIALTARAAAEEGSSHMAGMVAAMAEINNSSQSISKIIKTIDEIAFQTNLLALNAAVEAARAGQHGKGFAVVAEEVRNLAARSAKAARETAELIEGSVDKVESGSAIADKTATSLAEIVSGVGKVTDLVAEIAAASNEQAQGIAEISTGMGQIDQVTQQNTANAEESASAAEELSGQSAQLRQMLMRFKLDSGSGSRPALAPVKSKGGAAKPRPAAPRPKPLKLAATAAESGWGEMEANPSRPSAPSEVIALDDDEFGKY